MIMKKDSLVLHNIGIDHRGMTSYLSSDASFDQDARRVAADLAAVYAAHGTSNPHPSHGAKHRASLLRRLTHRA